MSRKPKLDPAAIRRMLDYRAADGVLIWRENGQRKRAGSVAGTMTKSGTCNIFLQKSITTRARCVWCWHNGAWPEGSMRHLNGNLSDDRIENLQVESFYERILRARGLQDRKLPPGVRLAGDRFSAMVTVNGRSMYLGTFDDEQAAFEAFKQAHVAVHGERSPYLERGDDK